MLNSKLIIDPNHEYIEDRESIIRDLHNKYIEEMNKKEMSDFKKKIPKF